MTYLVLPLPTRRATIHLGQHLARAVAGGDLVVLSGELGAGKTFLTRAMCRALGLPAEERVTSPTFTLVSEHQARVRVYHADLYRLAGAAEVLELGLAERRDDGALVVVEWGEPFIAELGGDALVVSLSVEPRSARITATGPRAAEVLAALRGPG